MVSASRFSARLQLRDDGGRFTAALGLQHHTAPRHVDEARLERLMRLPQFAVVDVLDRVPERGIAAALHPVGAQVTVVDETHLRREPGVDVHAVGDVADRNVLLAHARKERRPHRA